MTILQRTYPPVIGLNGVARAGKDTVAGILHDLYGYEIRSFSEVLNQCLYTLDRAVGSSAGITIPLVRDFGRETVYERYADLVDRVGYEEAKEYNGVRRLLQAMGTEVGRDLLGDDIWVQALFNQIGAWDKVVITNVRFPNEYSATKRHHGVVWRVNRPGYTAANGHVSDTALDSHVFDQYIENDGSVSDLAAKVMHIMDNAVIA